MDDALVVYVTVPDEEAGARIARAVVEERLAACVNMVPAIRSFYRWEGRIEDDSESLLFMKTTAAAFPRLRERIIPCILMTCRASPHGLSPRPTIPTPRGYGRRWRRKPVPKLIDSRFQRPVHLARAGSRAVGASL